MKKQLILVLAIATLSLTGCEEAVNPINVSPPKPVQPLIISSFYPESGVGGIPMAIFGENFGPSVSDNYVTFNGAYSEILDVKPGMILLRIPMHLAQGDYSITLSALGKTATSKKMFRLNSSGF